MLIQNDAKKLFKMTETLAHGTHLRVLCESYPMNTNMTGFRRFSIKDMHPCDSDECSLSIGRVKPSPLPASCSRSARGSK